MPATLDKQSYARKRQRSIERERRLARTGQDIAPLPAIKNLARRTRADTDFRFFCETYFPLWFSKPWSPDHLKVISKIERAVLQEQVFAIAMPRGSGKTSLCLASVMWAILIGRHLFVFLIAPTGELALELLSTIKTTFETNDTLLEDYPEAIYPIRALEGEGRRCGGQRYYGQRTLVEWNVDELVMPTIPGSRCSGAVIHVSGLLGQVRGALHARHDGTTVRPSLVIVDDPQTDESAASPSQTARRLGVINGAIGGLAGPGRRTAIILPCTVIAPMDLADQLLNDADHPEWQGTRTKMIYEWSTLPKLWDEYATLRAESLRVRKDHQLASDFYAARRGTCGLPMDAARPCDACKRANECMDCGAVVGWASLFNRDELSALQHAWNLRLKDEAAFQAECQNDPIPAIEIREMLTPDEIASKVNGIPKAIIPMDATRLSAFIDVQLELLYYVVCAWREDFTGYVIDYGSWPDQHRSYFTLRDAERTIARTFPRAGFEGRIYSALDALSKEILSREYVRQDKATLRVERCLIDANWGQSTNIVYQFCRQSSHAAVLLPDHGRFVGASSIPMSDYKRKPGERVGHNWRIPNTRSTRAVRHVIHDANFWKSFVHARLAVAQGDIGGLSLYGAKPSAHRLLADHLTAEYKVQTEGRGRIVDEWKIKPNKPDNHWLDGLAGCAVAASMLGCATPDHNAKSRRSGGLNRRRVSFAERFQKKRAAQ